MDENNEMNSRMSDEKDSVVVSENIAKAIGGLYYAVYHIWMEDHTYVYFHEELDGILQLIGERGDYIKAFSQYIEGYIYPEDRAAMYEFSEFSTLADRLRGNKSISHVYRRLGVGWTRGQFIVAKRDEDGNIINVLYTVTDINDEIESEIQKKKEKENEEHDELTGLLNKKGLIALLEAGRFENIPVGALLLNIDRFERLNDSYGFKRGDEILIKMSGILRSLFSSKDIIVRVWDDEFLILMDSPSDELFEFVCKKIECIHAELFNEFDVEYAVTVSCGLCFFTDGYTEEKYEYLEAAYNYTKEHGRIGCSMMDSEYNVLKSWHDDRVKMPLNRVLSNNRTGTWRIEFPYNKKEKIRMYGDKILHELLDVPKNITPEKLYDFWQSLVDPEYFESLAQAREIMSAGKHVEVTYQWYHPVRGKIMVRCGGIVDDTARDSMCICGYHQDLENITVVSKNDISDEIRNALEEIYFCNYYIRMSDFTYVAYKEQDDAKRLVGSRGDATESFEKFIDNMVMPESHESMKKFLDLSTLGERLKNRNIIDCEYLSNSFRGWCKARLLVDRRDAKGEVLYVSFIVESIDDVKKKELDLYQELKKTLALAEQANQAKTDFLSRMSHDIRTPMNVIMGMTALAYTHSTQPDKLREDLEKIDISSNHLLSLINEVLDVRKIESGAMKLQEEEFNLSDLIRNILLMMRTEVADHMHTPELYIGHIEHENVVGDTLRIKQILINIISNSIKYTPDGGRIYFGVEEKATDDLNRVMYCFQIKDNGIGMSKEYIKHIYEPFSREEDNRVSKVQGTGLGMTIVHNLVELMGGNIVIQSEQGKGTQIDISIILGLSHNYEDAEGFDKLRKNWEEGKLIAKSGQKSTHLKLIQKLQKRALVVEDQEMNREIAREFLELAGMTVDSVENGKCAVDMVQSKGDNYYDIIFMDIQMPIMNGYEATRNIRKLNMKYVETLPIIAMTANAFAEDEKDAFDAGMNEHLAKPIDISKLNNVLQRWI